MTPKLFKAADVCEMAELQPYVLRSWEKEFPGIGVQKSPDSPRLYRQSDVDQVLRIKQLVFGEGLTLAGARRRLEETAQPQSGAADEDVAEVLDALGVRRAHADRERARRSAVDSQAAVERAGHGGRRGRLSTRAAVAVARERRAAIDGRAIEVDRRHRNASPRRKPARPAKRNKRASA